MNNFENLSERSIHASSAGIILLIFFAPFFNQTIFAESNPTTANNSQKEIKPSAAAPPESPLTKSSCKETPMQCSSLCQTALSAESQAARLDKSSKEFGAKADKASQRAVSIEEKTNKKLQKMYRQKNASSSGTASRQAKSVWTLVAIVPRLFVSNEANARSRREEKEAEKFGVNPSPNYPGKKAAELRMKSQMAYKSAEESRKVAVDAIMEADQARAHANSMRQSYESCLSGLE